MTLNKVFWIFWFFILLISLGLLIFWDPENNWPEILAWLTCFWAVLSIICLIIRQHINVDWPLSDERTIKVSAKSTLVSWLTTFFSLILALILDAENIISLNYKNICSIIIIMIISFMFAELYFKNKKC